MSITIGGDTLHYKTDEMKYITTYITEYNPAVDSYLNKIFDAIVPSYSSNKLWYSNRCGENAEFVCKTLRHYLLGHRQLQLLSVRLRR